MHFSNGYDIEKPCMHFSMHLLPRMTWHESGERREKWRENERLKHAAETLILTSSIIS
jgi:diadenosine tetraphosphate (Ap4A) HIT family hydrolase